MKMGWLTIGFSGTNDNHFLIPLQVQQYLPWETKDIEWRKLLATNGKMLDVILEKCKECKDFGSGTEDLRIFLLDYFSNKGRIAHALIDAGAILAGICIRDFAQFLLTECFTNRHSDLKGVTYFDNDEWKVMDLSGEIVSKNSSPLHERDTFVIFDEPRCRGVDMKLREHALAFISIGKEMRKDKFMQAAGRMRQLERQQSLLVIGERNIFSEISRNTHANNIDVHGAIKVGTKDVLNWIMKNTANAMVKGISQWAQNGLFFASESEAKHALLNDRKDLVALYGTPSETKRLSDTAIKSRQFHFKRTGSCLEDIADSIIDRVTCLGEGYTVVSLSGADEECERELQREVEKEEEEEIQLPSMLPNKEVDWKYEQVFVSSSAKEACPECMKLSQALSQLFSVSSVSTIGWSEKVYGTKNFLHTITSTESSIDLDNFLRIPNYFLSFSSGDILLLSDREAQVFLSMENKFLLHGSWSVSFCHVEFELDYSSNRTGLKPSKAPLRVGLRKKNLIDVKQRCSLKLFNGESNFSNKIERAEMKKMLLVAAKARNKSEKLNVTALSGRPESLLIARGKYVDYEMSDLDNLTSEIACELDCLDLS